MGQFIYSSVGGGGSPFATDILVNGHTIGRGANDDPASLALGYAALGQTIAGAIQNTATGVYSLASLKTGIGNVGDGYGTLQSLVAGNYNFAGGWAALSANLGSHNVAIGAGAGALDASGSYKLYIDGTGTGTLTPLIGGEFDPAGGLLGYVKINGGLHAEIKTVAGNYQVLDGDYTLCCDASGGAMTVLLQATPKHGDIKNIKQIDGSINRVTIDGNGNPIDNSATLVIQAQYDSFTLQYHSNYSTWYIL